MKPWETAPERYDELLEEKVSRVEGAFASLDPPTPAVVPSPHHSYRVRAEFRVWHSGTALDFVMFDPANPREPVAIDDFVPAVAPIRDLFPRLRAYLQTRGGLRRKLFQVEFLAGDESILVTLIYHRRLDEAWEGEARTLAQDLGIDVIGRSRGQKVVLVRDHVTQTYSVGERAYVYRQYEQSFVQPNGPVNQEMLRWVWARTAGSTGDLLELYCGNGNFTLPLASRYASVLATELSKIGTRAARENLEANAVRNVDVARLSAEEVSQALAGERVFRRLANLERPLEAYDLASVFVDPPRAGLDTATLELVRRFPSIIYISCNPQTLRDNLSALAASHRIDAFALFDQFPYTQHLECGVILTMRDKV